MLGSRGKNRLHQGQKLSGRLSLGHWFEPSDAGTPMLILLGAAALSAVVPTGSPTLQTYERAVAPFYQKQAVAGFLVTCGIRSDAWYGTVVNTLNTALLNDVKLQSIKSRLSREEHAQALHYFAEVGAAEYRFQGGLNQQACQQAANASFLPYYDRLAAGVM
ncbi:hypothetical protein [Sphingomonas sp.]|uniref:hypothetical protein n=1 Tax=Sphingomonas sp. TaxID=28214 RepID=UPI003AFFFD7D